MPSSAAAFPVWGGRAIVAVASGSQLPVAIESVRQIVDDFDLACSSFREDSELAALNAGAGRPIAVSRLLLDAVEVALRAARLTDGAVDPTIGDALVAFGLNPPPGDAPRIEIRRVPGWQAVEVDREAGTIRLATGVRLDLGATAKALAADRAAAAANAACGTGTLVSLAGDLAVCGRPPDGGWRVRVTDDHRSDESAPGQWILLGDGGLATSSTTVRSAGGAHHLIDPSTGRPATIHFRTASVAAASCLDANIASTAAIVRGAPAAGWLDSLGLPARLVQASGIVEHVGGWPSGGEELPLQEMAVRA